MSKYRTIVRWFVVAAVVLLAIYGMQLTDWPFWVRETITILIGAVGGLWIGLRREREEKK